MSSLFSDWLVAPAVEILNKTQNRQITYWEPFNELDKTYKDADKLDELWKIYNLVATRMKKVDSRIKVGGPALTWRVHLSAYVNLTVRYENWGTSYN